MVASTAARFAAAVGEHPFPDFVLDPEALARAQAALDGSALLVLGEPHGVRETPSFLYALAVALDARAVAFEWSHEEMDGPVQEFVRGGSFDFEELWSRRADAELFSGDGRVTAGHFALLERLRRDGRLEQAIVFDRLDPGPVGDWTEQVRVREPEMARRLLREWNGTAPLLVLAGAFHAQLEAEEGEPFAAHLARSLPGLEPAMLDYSSGRCWSRGELHDVSGPMPPAPIVFRLGEATPAIVPGRSG